jgi:hypothetical protein
LFIRVTSFPAFSAIEHPCQNLRSDRRNL